MNAHYSRFYFQTKEYVEKLLISELPESLYYHDLQHTKDVVSATEEICLAEDISPEEKEIAMIAAWFHDTGYTKSYIGHEDESMEIAAEFLNGIGYPENDTKLVVQLISATRYKHEPENILEACLIDADRLGMGKVSFLLRGELLRKEWEINLDKYHSTKEWLDIQVNYLKDTRFFTEYASRHYNELKDNNVERVLRMKEQLLSEEDPTLKLRKKTVKRTRKVLKQAVQFGALGLLISLSTTLSVWGFEEDILITAILSGMLIGLVLRVFEGTYERNIERRINFPLSLFTRTGVMGLLFLLSIGTAGVIYAILISEKPTAELYEERIEFVFATPENLFRFLLLILIVSFMFNYIKLTRRIIGKRVLRNYMLGRYSKPISEERLFMFIDINSSTALAERLGPDQYHLLLNNFFRDISPAITKTKGEIYQYVGDEVVVTWPMEEGIKKNNAIRCFFEIERNMFLLTPEYERIFGIRPDFKAGLHGGKVISAEVGTVKSEIVYHGDVVNTTERILNQCIPQHRKILVSEYITRKMNLSPFYEAEFVTTIRLKGKESEISLYSVKEITT